MFQSITRGIAVMLLAVASAAITVTSAILKSRYDEKSAAGKILEKRGLNVDDFYCSPLDYRLSEEERSIQLKGCVEDVKLHLVAKDGSLLEDKEKIRKAS